MAAFRELTLSPQGPNRGCASLRQIKFLAHSRLIWGPCNVGAPYSSCTRLISQLAKHLLVFTPLTYLFTRHICFLHQQQLLGALNLRTSILSLILIVAFWVLRRTRHHNGPLFLEHVFLNRAPATNSEARDNH